VGGKMNDYIINPWFFYYIGIADSLHTALVVFQVIATLYMILSSLCCYVGLTEDKPDLVRIWKPWFKKSTVAFLVLLPTLILFPSRETIIQMTIASKVTYTNVKAVKKEAKDLVDYVITKSKELAKQE